MTECEFCGETVPDDARTCPRCGNSRPAEDTASDGEVIPTATLSGEETAALFKEAEADDGWRPSRYERTTRRLHGGSRTRRPDRQTLQLLAGWLAALIVIAGGIFWYIWSEDEAAVQAAARPAVITAEQR